MTQHKSHAPALFAVFSVFWILLAINPSYRDIWLVENIILIVCLIYLLGNYHKHPFSNRSYWLIFVFCILQTIGAHYTYAEVPLGFWAAELLDIERNHYDRFVHFAFGFLVILPFKEVMERKVKFNSRAIELFTLVMLFIGISGSYEIVESWYAMIYEAEKASDMFLGSQGDIWDAEKDVFLAGLGAWLYLVLFTRRATRY